MINKVKGEFVAECNGCGTEYYGGTIEEFREFLDELKNQEGWEALRVQDQWEHYCRECSKPK